MNTTKKIEEKVLSYIKKHHMLTAGDRVVAGVSGGADSVCLLFLLLEWAKQTPLEIAVVHVNHGIRAEAAADADYVKALCREQKIPYYLKEIDVPGIAEKEKCSLEEAGRKARYEIFAEVAEEFGGNKIAVAHNCNDCSETMLFHLFRGSGLKGLGSIRPVRDQIIRPLLCLERREIEAYLEVRKIFYCQDATNAHDDYTRNRIRHHILPYAEENIVKGCVSHMAQTAELLTETEDYLEQQTQFAMEKCMKAQLPDDSSYRLDVELLLNQHPLLQKRILHQILKELSPGQKDISYLHVQMLLDLFTGEGNRSVNLPFGICGRREYTDVIVGIVSKERNGLKDWEEQGDLPDLQEGNELQFSVLPAEDFLKNNLQVPEKKYTKWFDYDKIKKSPVLRTRETGDYLMISDGAGGMIHKSVKDFMIDRKIPKVMRDSIPVLAEENHILWLVGYRISEYYKINENTKRILQVELIKKQSAGITMEEKNGRTC